MSPTSPEYREVARTVGTSVKAELARHGKTQADLAGVLDLTPHTVGRRISGEAPFDVVELAKTARWLGVDIAVFNMPSEVVA